MAVIDIRLLTDGYFLIDLGFLVYGKAEYYGKKYKAALKPLLLRTDDDMNILVDTGIGDLPKKYKRFYPVERPATLINSLKSVGIDREQIDMVINTHLHLDHCGNNKLFPNAEFIVQAVELEYARNPHRFQKGGYLPELFDVVEYSVVRNDCKLLDGVEVISTPGHTPGHQSVIVTTIDGKRYIYCGDVAPLSENLERRNITGILYNPVELLNSIDKLRSYSDYSTEFIYSHDNTQLSIGRRYQL